MRPIVLTLINSHAVGTPWEPEDEPRQWLIARAFDAVEPCDGDPKCGSIVTMDEDGPILWEYAVRETVHDIANMVDARTLAEPR